MRTQLLILLLFYYLPIVSTGQEKEWLPNHNSFYTSASSTHFILNSYDGYVSTQTASNILKERELAYKKISGFFELKTDFTINIFLFAHERLKYKITGHKGLGWGFEKTIVEVFNDSIYMDPYHELVHAIGYTLNKPPALIDEGIAVYLSQLYGDNAFSKLIRYPNKSTNKILLMLNKREGSIDIATLLSYDDICKSENTILAYCTSASFVEFLVTEFGKQKFLELYKSLSNSDNAGNEQIFEDIYSLQINDLENAWKKKRLDCN